MKTNRQGVRDLDAIGPKPQRGHVGRPREQDRLDGRPFCKHEFQRIPEFDDYGGVWWYRRCEHCGERR